MGTAGGHDALQTDSGDGQDVVQGAIDETVSDTKGALKIPLLQAPALPLREIARCMMHSSHGDAGKCGPCQGSMPSTSDDDYSRVSNEIRRRFENRTEPGFVVQNPI